MTGIPKCPARLVDAVTNLDKHKYGEAAPAPDLRCMLDTASEITGDGKL